MRHGTDVTPAIEPLLDRSLDAVVFDRPSGPVVGARFLGAAARLAAMLPDRPAAWLCCEDRFAFALAFAATLLRGQVAVLAEQAPADAFVLSDHAGPGAARCCFDAAALLDGEGWSGAPPVIPAARMVAVVATSGSTGRPVMHEKRFGALVQRSRAAGVRFGLRAARPASVVGTVPPRHMYGFETTILLPLHAPAASWCGPAFFPRDVAAALAGLPGPRLLVSTPLQLRNFLAADLAFPELAGVISATAPVDVATAAAVEARWGAPFHEIFGATEVGSVASRRTTDGALWQAYPGVELAGDGDAVEGDAVEGDAVVVRAPFAPPVRLDDAVELAGGGWFRLVGRQSDVVKLGGRRASLEGLNRILAAVPGVADGVFVVPDDLDRRPTARLTAFVVAPGRTAGEIRQALRGRIDAVFLPRRIVMLERLPRNEIGKLPRQALAALAEG
jgi:acyl-coenzyme A synthetase/AMP-(fatty) acid ligase